MKQIHEFGEKVFVDFSGMTVEYTSLISGEVLQAQVFVGVLGASNYTFVHAAENQKLESWISLHTKMLEYFGGVPKCVVPDNLKAGVSRACKYEPDTNPIYLQWAEHYNTSIFPARPYKPRDKPKAEVGVQIVQRWILARLRNQTFSSVNEINSAIKPLLEMLNDKKMRQFGISRRELFASFESTQRTSHAKV
jgi:transposase